MTSTLSRPVLMLSTSRRRGRGNVQRSNTRIGSISTPKWLKAGKSHWPLPVTPMMTLSDAEYAALLSALDWTKSYDLGMLSLGPFLLQARRIDAD